MRHCYAFAPIAGAWPPPLHPNPCARPRHRLSKSGRSGSRTLLEPVDALAPALLDAPVRRELVVKLFGSDAEPYGQLRQAMQLLLNETAESEPHFESLDLDDESGPWMLVRRVLQAADGARGLKARMVTKMLHRKRPLFVPIFDSKVAAFYGATSSRPWRLWPALQADVRGATDLLDDLRARRDHSRRPAAVSASDGGHRDLGTRDHRLPRLTTLLGGKLLRQRAESIHSPFNQGCMPPLDSSQNRRDT